jgi:hypothetical protein
MPAPAVNRILRSKRPIFGSDRNGEINISGDGLTVSGGNPSAFTRRGARGIRAYSGDKRFYGFTPSGATVGDNKFRVGLGGITTSLVLGLGDNTASNGWDGANSVVYWTATNNSADPWPTAAGLQYLVAWDGPASLMWTWSAGAARWSGTAAGNGNPVTALNGLALPAGPLYVMCSNDGNTGSITFDPNPTSHPQYSALVGAGFLPVGL